MARLALRKAFGESPGSLTARAASVGVTPRCTVREIVDAFEADIVFADRLVTSSGVPLGGAFRLTLQRDGQWAFTGYFHASGLPSYNVSLLVTAGFALSHRSPGLKASFQMAFAERAVVHDRHTWSQHGTEPLVRANWSQVRASTFGRRLEHDADWFGPLGDLAAFLGEIILMNGAFGPAGAAIALLGDVATVADLDELMLPGLVGVGLAAGAVYFISPGLMIPAFIGGVLASAALVKQSPLSQAERDFADEVFKGTIPYDRIVKTNLLGVQDRGFTFPLPGGAIVINLGELCYANPTTYDGWGTDTGTAGPGQFFIHELTHAWQIAHDSFTPWLYCRGVVTAVASTWDESVYHYGAPDTPWSDLGVEQQAELVCEWFAGDDRQSAYGAMRDDSPPPPGFSPPNPYFRYIRDHIRAELT